MDWHEGNCDKFGDIISRFPKYTDDVLVKDMSNDDQEDAAFGGCSGTNAGVMIRLVKEETGEEVNSAGSGQGN
jgi:hypothetical protein